MEVRRASRHIHRRRQKKSGNEMLLLHSYIRLYTGSRHSSCFLALGRFKSPSGASTLHSCFEGSLRAWMLIDLLIAASTSCLPRDRRHYRQYLLLYHDGTPDSCLNALLHMTGPATKHSIPGYHRATGWKSTIDSHVVRIRLELCKQPAMTQISIRVSC